MIETAAATAPRRAGAIRRNVARTVEDPTRSAFVFTVADLIDGIVKDQNPDWARGGVIRGQYKTLEWCSGYIPRCEIREMVPAMDSDSPSNIQESSRRHLDTTYVQDVRDPETGELKEVVHGNKRADGSQGHDGLLRHPVYPLMELPSLVSQVDGVVEMPCRTAEEAALAQKFLFPNWDEIKSGEKPLPTSLATLKAYFLRRQAAASTGGAQADFFLKVAKAAVRSCDQYRTFGSVFTRQMISEYRRAEKNGWAWSIGSQMEMVCEQLGIQRPDLQEQQSADKLDRLTETVDKFVDAQLRREKAPDLEPPPVVEAPAAAPVTETPQPEPETSTEAEVEQCMATTGSGAQCKNPAEADGFCTISAHNAENEAKKEDARAAAEAAEAAKQAEKGL